MSKCEYLLQLCTRYDRIEKFITEKLKVQLISYQDVRQQIIAESSESGQGRDCGGPDSRVLENDSVVDVPDVASGVRGSWTLRTCRRNQDKVSKTVNFLTNSFY
jgi:hypothetical protein